MIPLTSSIGDGHRIANQVFGSFGIARPRTLVGIDNTYVAATHSMEWPNGLNLQFLVILVKQNIAAAAAMNGSEAMLLAIDPVDDTEAAAYLGAGDVPAHRLTDAGFWMLPINQIVRIPLVKPMKNGSLGGGRLDFRAIGPLSFDVYVGAN